MFHYIILIPMLFSMNIHSEDSFNFNKEESKDLVRKIKTKLPMKIDKNTTLYNIYINENILFLDYKLINWVSSEIKDEQIERAKKPVMDFVKPSFCDNPLFLRYMENKYDLMISYSTNDEIKLFEFKIKESDCAKI